MAATRPLLEIENVSKEFPGVKALDNVSLEIHQGELMALLGENGAGKSTLVKILSGAYTRDDGQIRINGRELPKKFSPVDARKLGIAIIYQELSLLPHLSVAENIYLGMEPLKSSLLRAIDFTRMRESAREKLAQLNADHIPVTTLVNSLSLPEKQMVEIASALAVNCRVVIMDEPTTTLTGEETQKLFDVISELKKQEVTIIYISHRLDEIFQIADRVTILRDGKLVDSVDIKNVNTSEIISMMTGKQLREKEHHLSSASDVSHKDVLKVENFSDGKLLQDVSFQVRENEVLGIAGLVGSGRTELARMIFGADKRTAGKLYLDGKQVEFSSPKQAMSAGVGYLSENRKEEGLNLGLELQDNIVITDYSEISTLGVINNGKQRNIAADYINRMNIKGKPQNLAKMLSGGNQQKVAISKWLHIGCKVLIFDEPTRGIDVIAKAEVLAIIREFASEGRAAVVIASEIDDLLDICDRIMVMSKGHVVTVLDNKNMSKDHVLTYVTGGN